jgi:hypothetical protein
MEQCPEETPLYVRRSVEKALLSAQGTAPQPLFCEKKGAFTKELCPRSQRQVLKFQLFSKTAFTGDNSGHSAKVFVGRSLNVGAYDCPTKISFFWK